jgi:hypothetical protein
MTPKEKAKQLVNTYIDIENKFNVDLFCDECGIERAAKYCALIAVDEILEAIDWHEFEHPNDEINYWFEVKEEIEKL